MITSTRVGYQVQEAHQAARAGPGSDPGRVSMAWRAYSSPSGPGDGQQGDGREHPADGVAGSVGDDQGPDHHERAQGQQQRHRVAEGSEGEAAVGHREPDQAGHADGEDGQQ
jgi:hypothetical protein